MIELAALLDPLQYLEYGFMRRAFLAALLIAVLSAILGVYVVLRGQAMLGDGIAHISFAGVAIGLTAGLYPLGMGLVAAVVGALLIHFLQSRGIVKSDTAIGILFTAGLAIGVLVVSSGPGLNVNVHAFLFGNLLAVQERDLYMVFGLGVLLIGLVTVLRKELFAITFNPEAARLSGLPVGLLDALFSVVTAATIVVAVRIVGVLLVSALLVVPAASALQWATSFASARRLSVAFGLTGVFVGLWFGTAYGLATGASIALATTALFGVATTVARLRRGA